MSTPKLFQSIKVGDVELKHRIVLAPLTRFRADSNHVPSDLQAEYYAQRASTPGTLLITEATFITERAGGYPNVPALESDAQVEGWNKVVDAVHAKGSYIYAQLWALGRAANPEYLSAFGYDYVSASDVPLKDMPKPRPLTTPEVKEYVQWYTNAAINAVQKAGFDGVEIHAANGYLPHQFLEDHSNLRTDEYGGSIENRARFTLEVVDSISKAIGPTKTGIRISPFETFQQMGMQDPYPTYTYVVNQLLERHPDLAYIHAIDPRARGVADSVGANIELVSDVHGKSLDFIRKIWGPRPFISAGFYTPELALETAETKGDLIAFGRYFIANPDLPYRIKNKIPLTPWNSATFYIPESPVGYTDYPFADSEKKAEAAL
ncbi:NADH:flavin oxidoreductase/NADH oxidase [Abortiporus biennis]|nr:NADH:flavin oxidoreductase/NADH oxidase [Abortiporus biennis]